MHDTEIPEDKKEYARNALQKLPLARLLGMKLVDIRIGAADVQIEMRDDLRQPHGVLHGGVTATLIDTAMAFAVRTMIGAGEPTATVDLTVHYLRPHFEGTAVCKAKVVKPGKRFFNVSAEVVNEEGKLIATGISTYTKL
jgi:acyl-CoA thioesterase